MIFACAGWEDVWSKVSSFIDFVLDLSTRKDIFIFYLGGRERAALLTALTDVSLSCKCCRLREYLH